MTYLPDKYDQIQNVTINNLDSRVTTNEADIVTLQNANTTIGNDITNLDNRVTTNEADISTLQTNVTTNTTNILNNLSQIQANASDISNNTALISNNTSSINNLNTTKVTKGGDVMTGSLEIGTNSNHTLSFRTNNTLKFNILTNGLLQTTNTAYDTIVLGDTAIPNKKYTDDKILAQTLTQHSDVTIAGPITLQVLTYNGTDWINRSTNLDDLFNVTVPTPVVGERLEYNGSQWVRSVPTYGQCYWSGNTTPENGGADLLTGIAYKLSAATSISTIVSNFTHTNPNRLTYNGTFSMICRISFSVCFNTSDNDRSFQVAIRINNGSILNASRTCCFSRNSPAGANSCSNSFLHQLNPNEFAEIVVINQAGNTALTVASLNLNIELIKRL